MSDINSLMMGDTCNFARMQMEWSGVPFQKQWNYMSYILWTQAYILFVWSTLKHKRYLGTPSQALFFNFLFELHQIIYKWDMRMGAVMWLALDTIMLILFFRFEFGKNPFYYLLLIATCTLTFFAFLRLFHEEYEMIISSLIINLFDSTGFLIQIQNNLKENNYGSTTIIGELFLAGICRQFGSLSAFIGLSLFIKDFNIFLVATAIICFIWDSIYNIIAAKHLIQSNCETPIPLTYYKKINVDTSIKDDTYEEDVLTISSSSSSSLSPTSPRSYFFLMT